MIGMLLDDFGFKISVVVARYFTVSWNTHDVHFIGIFYKNFPHCVYNICGINLLTYVAITTRLSGFSLLSRRFYFARASSSSSHQAKSGLLQPVLSNAYAFLLAAYDRRPQTLVSEKRLHTSERHGQASGTAGY